MPRARRLTAACLIASALLIPGACRSAPRLTPIPGTAHFCSTLGLAQTPLHAEQRHDTLIHASPGHLGLWPEIETARPLELAPPPAGERIYTLESEILPAPAPFFEAILSANIDVKPGCIAALELRVARPGRPFCQYLRVMTWGDGDPAALGPAAVSVPDANGTVVTKIDIDYLTSSVLLDRAQYRIRAAGPALDQLPAIIHRVALCTSSPQWRWTSIDAGARAAPVRMDVPFRSQKTQRPDLAGRLCSPTSVTMVLAYHGLNTPVFDVAQTALDREHDVFGNWPRNVQTAFSFGVPGIVSRISRWDQVRDLLAAGRVIVASIRVDKAGQLRGAPYKTTGGHLIVLTGLDENGDVYVNDPAVADAAAGRLVYAREDLTRVWLSATGGTCYIFMPRSAAP